ncbi:MAG: GDSL-like protein [Pseudomonadota bacterium]
MIRFSISISLLMVTLTAHAASRQKTVPVVLCLGDSLTEGYEISPDAAFPALLDQKLKEKFGPEAQAINAGISGATSASGEGRLKFQLKATKKPTHMILALGANDGLRGLPVAEMKKNLETTIKLAKSSGIKVLLAGMKVPPNYGAGYAKSFEATFKTVAREQQVSLIPFLLDGVAANAKLNLDDGIHPNPAGHKILVETVWNKLEPML